MKPFMCVCILGVSMLVLSCKDVGPGDDGANNQNLPMGKMELRFADPPPGITSVTAKLTRQGFQERTLVLVIANSTASGTLQDLAVGLWHLKVDARDSTEVIRYSGETDVEVRGGEMANVSLQLMPTSGGVQILVTWGNPPIGSTLINGNFEQGPAVGTYVPLNQGSTALTGWTVTRGQIDIVRYWQSFEGSRSIDLNGTPGRGGIRQTIRTIAGNVYRIQFAMAGNPEGPPIVKSMGLTASSQSTEFSFNTTGKTITNMGWETKNWNFTAADSLTTIEFYSLTPEIGIYGPAIDAVTVQPVQ
jgi:choice-of-anchor C domain-containing protein